MEKILGEKTPLLDLTTARRLSKRQRDSLAEPDTAIVAFKRLFIRSKRDRETETDRETEKET
jgi:hypothetical protein